MIPFSEIYSMIESHNVVYLVISDRNGNKVTEIGPKDKPSQVVEDLRNQEQWLTYHEKVQVKAGTEKQHQGNMTNCFKWNFTFASTPATAIDGVQMAGIPGGNMAILPMFLNYMQTTQAQLMQLNIALVKAESKKKSGLLDGLPVAELAQAFLASRGVQMPTPAPANLQGAAPETAGQEWSEEEATELGDEIDKLAGKVDFNKAKTLLKMLNENPALADMALNFK